MIESIIKLYNTDILESISAFHLDEQTDIEKIIYYDNSSSWNKDYRDEEGSSGTY